MSTEIVVPFGLAPDGSIATTTDPNAQVQQHIEALIATSAGERVMLPTYGVGVANVVFAPNDDIVVADLSNRINAAMATWEPTVNIVNIGIVEIPGDPAGSAGVEIDWTSTAVQQSASSGVQTATILVGGTVVGTGIQT
jgi:uncharacterized protein